MMRISLNDRFTTVHFHDLNINYKAILEEFSF